MARRKGYNIYARLRRWRGQPSLEAELSMNRLTIALCTIALALATSCGATRAPEQPARGAWEREPAPAPRLTQASAGLRDTVRRQAALPQTERLDGSKAISSLGFDPSSLLGPVPSGGADARRPSAVNNSYQDGAPGFMASANTVVAGTNLVLAAPVQGVSWAVYQLPALTPGDELAFLYVDSTDHNFSGRTPGMWICFANYETGKWELISRTESLAYKRTLSKTAPYLSPSSNVYVGLIVEDGQGTTIEQVGVGVSRDWATLTLQSGSSVGIHPCVALDQYASVHVAYSDGQAANPQYGMCLGTDDPLALASWNFSLIDTGSPGNARWLDMVIDSESGHPTVSYIYDNLSDPEGNSQVVLGALVDHPTQGLVWANYPFYVDGAVYSSLDQCPTDGSFGFACCAGNQNSAPSNLNDIEYRRWDLNVNWDPSDNGPVDKYSGFGEDYFYPHLRFAASGNTAIGADGGFLFYENGPDDWTPIYERPEAEDFGSLACAPPEIISLTVMGATYCEVQSGVEKLFYVNYDDTLIGVAELVDSQPVATGGFMAGTSQLAFTRSGEPVIAYTVRKNGKVSIRFARKTGGEWKIETPVADAGDSTDRLGVVVDIAVEQVNLFFPPTGRTVIVYNNNTGGQDSLAIAVKDDLLAD